MIKQDEYYAHLIVPISEVYRNITKNIDAYVVVYANVTNSMVKYN